MKALFLYQAIDFNMERILDESKAQQLAGKISVDSLFCDGGSTLDIANENSLSIIKGLSINSKLGFPVIISSLGYHYKNGSLKVALSQQQW